MKHLIIFPYWCREELDRYFELGKNWDKLTKTEREVEFLFLGRWDVAPDVTHDIRFLLYEFAKYAKVKSVRCTTPKFNQPEMYYQNRHIYAKHMFIQCMEYVEKMYEDDGGFVFWMESDVMLMRNDWIDKLHEEWTDSDAVLMGHKITKDTMDELKTHDYPEHFNGVACYSKRFVDYVPMGDLYSSYRSFDALILDALVENGYEDRTKDSDVWDHRLDFWCNPTRMDEDIPENVCILHGCKRIGDFRKMMEIGINREVNDGRDSLCFLS